MDPDDSGRPRVLLGNLEPLVRLGMMDVLSEDGLELIGEEPAMAAKVLLNLSQVLSRRLAITTHQRNAAQR